MAKRETLRRRTDGGIRYFEPQEQQRPVLQCRRRGNLVLGGNRGGKTVVGAAETAFRLLGEHPHKPVHRAPIKAWICSQDLPGKVKPKADGEQETHKQLEQLRRWIPRDALRGGSWERSFSPGEMTLSLANGSLAVFKGYDQGLLKFESDAIHWAWFDEEPDDKRIWTSTLLRLADYDGQWMITATPVLSLQGKGWLEDLWEDRAELACGYETHQLYSYSNPYLDGAVLDQLFGNLTEEEKQVRAYGAFARLGGRVLSEFDPRRHLVDDYLPGRDLPHWLVIDPGWNTAAHLFAVADSRGRLTLYDELYARQMPIPQRMAILHALWMAHGRPEIDVIVDSAAFEKTRQGGTEHETRSDVAEYLDAAMRIGATWFNPRRCIKADSYAYRVKRYLANDFLFVCRGLRWWQWEQERWTRQKEREGPTATERPVPDAPIKRYDHLLDCTRYLINELPDPFPIEPDTRRDIYQEHWKRMRESQNAELVESIV